MKIARWFLLSLFFLIFVGGSVSAATGINDQISFQGKVVNTNGTNVANGSYDFVFSLYTVSSGGTAVWTETWNSGTAQVTVTDGIFQVNLGTHTDLPGSIDFNTDNIYLGIEFNGDGEMSPRVHFTAAPYAFNAQKVGGLTVTDTTGTLTIPNGETISFGGSFTTSASNDVTLTTSGATDVTLPTTGTLATLAGIETLTNKTIGSTGLTFSGASTDITTASGEDLTLTAVGAGVIVLSDSVTSGALTISGVATDITTGTDESLVIVANGAGTIDLQDATTVDSLTTDIGGVSIAASQSYTGAGAVTLSSAATTTLTLDSGTTGNLDIGTGSNAKTITLGNSTTTTTVNINSGTGGINLQAAGTGVTDIVQVGTGGTGSTTPDFFGLDVKSDTGDPAGGFEGAMYYNTFDNKFRCYQGSAWTDCISAGTFTSFTVAGTSGSNQTITDGNTLTLAAGSGISTTGSAVDTVTIALASLSADWNQTGAFDIALNNASSELKILESSGDTYYGIFDVTDLTTSDKTYTFPDASGTVITTGNISDITGLTDSQISDTLTASSFVGSGSSTNAVDLATAEVNGVLPIANGGTNKALTLAAGAIVWTDTDSFEVSAVGTAGQALVSGGTGAPTFFAPTAGSIIFAGTSGVLSQDNANFFWDDSNNRLGLGTTTPAVMLDIYGTSNALRLSYDGSNYATLSTNSSGDLSLTSSNTSEAAIIVGSGASQDASVQFDGASVDYFAGLDHTSGSFLIGSGFTVQTGSAFLNITSGGLVGINMTPTARFDITHASTSTTGATEYSLRNTFSDTGIVTTGTDTTYGNYTSLTRTGATGGTINSYGDYITATGDTGGTSTLYGQYITATGADTTYGIASAVTAVTAGLNYGFSSTVTDTTTGANTNFGTNVSITDSGVVASGIDTTYGNRTTISRTGATGGTLFTYGQYTDVTNTFASGSGTAATYGQYISATGGTTGTTSLYGSYVTASGADSNNGYWALLAAASGTSSNGYGATITDSTTTGNSNMGGSFTISDTGVVTTGTDTNYGSNIAVTRTGATGGTLNTYGLNLSVTTDNAGSGTSTAYGLNIDTGTSGSTNADTVYGLKIATEANTSTTAYGLYVDAGTQAGTEYAAAFLNGNVGIGDATPDALLDIDFSSTNGTLTQVAAPSSVTLDGNLTGQFMSLGTNVTATDFNVTAYLIGLPSVTNTGAGSYVYRGVVLGGGNTLTQNTAAGTTSYRGFSSANPNLVQTTGTAEAYGVYVSNGSNTTGGNQYGFHLAGTGVGAGTLTGVNLSAITGGAGTETAIAIGSGWDTLLDTASIDITGAGAITGATGITSATGDITATAGNVAITAGVLTLNGTTRISNAGVGTFITGTVIGSQTFTTNSITDSGALTITSAATTALTIDSGTTGVLNLGTGNNAKTISLGTGTAGNAINIGTNNTTSDTIAIGSALDNVSITGDQWSITDAGVLTVQSCSGCGGGSQTPWTADIDADGFDLNDLSNILFRETTGAPAGTDVGFYRDNTGDLTGNVLTGKTFNLAVNGTDEYNFSSTALALNSNNITGLGTNLTAADALTIASTTNGLTLDSGSNTLTIAATDTTLTASGITTLTLGTNTTIASAGTITLDATSTTIIPDADTFQTNDVTSTGALTLTAGSTAQNITLTPTTTGYVSIASSTATSDTFRFLPATGAAAFAGIFTTADLTGADKTYTFPNATITINAAADISGTTLASNVVTSSLTTVGTLGSLTVSGAIAANGGITFDQSTDTVGAFTAAGTIDMNTNILTNIGNSGTDFVATTGALTLAGVLTANGGISIGSQSLTGTTGIIDYTNFDVSAAGTVTLAAGQAFTGAGAITLSSGGSSGLTLDSASGVTTIATGDYLALSHSGVSGAAAGYFWYDSSDNKFKINENGTTKVLCNTTDLGCGGGGTTWDTIGDAAASGAIAMNEYAQTLDWNTAATAGAFDGLTVTITNDATSDAATQRAFVVANLDDSASTGTTETIAQIVNRDINETVGTGLLVENTGAGTMTDAIKILETAGTITTAINIGNNVTTGISIGTGVTTGILVQSGGIDATGQVVFTNTGTGLSFEVNDQTSDTTPFAIDQDGNVGIGTSSPNRILDIVQAASAPQLRLSKDLTNYSEMTVDSVGDLQVSATGGDIRALTENVWVCDGGACPALTLTGQGNIFVENVLKFGNGVYLKNDSATELGVYDNDDNAMLIFDEL